MNQLATGFFTATILLLASGAQAQVTFSVGPRVGLNITTYDFIQTQTGVFAKLRVGFEGGLMASLGNGGHFSLQPAVLYSQKERTQATVVDIRNGNNLPIQVKANVHNTLNYLAFPINFAYTLRTNGQGFQVFAGPYLGVLLNGQFETAVTSSTTNVLLSTDDGMVTTNAPDASKNGYFAQRLDIGVQTGLGYRYQGLLVQLGYSWGLRNLTTRYAYQSIVINAPYYNRAFQASLTYLFDLKK